MVLKDKIRFVLWGSVCIVLLLGCSTGKNTQATRAYHEFTARYNVFFNAQETYNETLKNQMESFSDDYTELLPLYPSTPTKEKTQPGGPFDAVIDKTTKAIREHSISAKPRRDPSQRQTQEYREWLRQEEFNPFIKSAWLLMGKGHVQNQDYNEALSVFSQILRIYKQDIDVVSEAQIWMMRAYTEMNRMYDADNMMYILKTRALPTHLVDLFAETYTFYLLHKREYAEALPYLQKTIDREKNSLQKKRLQFLLGQTYAALGDNEKAFRAFEDVKGLSTPYELALNAFIAQSAVTTGTQRLNSMDELEKMSKKEKNKEYLDKIYYALGNMYLNSNDTAKAIQHYLLAEKESTTNALLSTHTPEIYYQLYQIYTRSGSDSIAQSFRQRLLQEYPDHEYAIAISDPNVEKRIYIYPKPEEAIYQQAYQTYMEGDATSVQTTFDAFREKYPDSGLMPQFLLLYALSHAQTGDAEKTERSLNELLQKYPQSDAAPLAQNIIDGLSQGRTLAANASLNRQWSAASANTIGSGHRANDTVRFSSDRNTPHFFLFSFPRNSVDKTRSFSRPRISISLISGFGHSIYLICRSGKWRRLQ